MRVWDEEQARLFLAEARRSSPHYPLYLTAVLTGMRQGELLGLRWQDVDLTLGVAHIRQTFCRIAGRMMFKEPKSPRSRRAVALPELVVDALRDVRDAQRRAKNVMGDAYEDRDLVFCQPNGKPLHGHNVARRDFRRIIARAKLPRIRFHDLRHCHATLLLRYGTNPKIVQERLGHSAIGVTMDTYSHVLPGMQAEAAQVVAERLLGRGMIDGPANALQMNGQKSRHARPSP
jgi:integrase